MRDDCLFEPQVTTGKLLLGALTPRDCAFRITASDQVVDTVAFTVPSGTTKTLSAPTRLPDGSLQFQIEGLAPFHYTIEASEELKTWIKVGQGALPGTYSDPDAHIFPQRYYRAVIGP